MPPGAAVYFVSDAHLGADSEAIEAPRRRRLHDFLAHLPGRAAALYVIGDLFDFWFEYGTAIPRRHFETLAMLRRLREAGIPVHYLNGNHDFWLGPFLRREMDLVTHSGAVTLETQGRRVWMHHGDGLVGGDLGYRLLKKVIRHPASIALYRLLHPDLGIPLAHHVSRWSRHSRPDRPQDLDRLWREIALPRFAEGFDAVLVGHFHQVVERREPGREFLVLGDWMEFFTYARLEEGRLTLERWS
jgi:UDP-2,3-diacylglucosamine hydrolase